MVASAWGCLDDHRCAPLTRSICGLVTLDMDSLPVELQTRSVSVPDRAARRLRLFNLVMGVLHLVSGSAMVALSNDFSLPVSTSWCLKSNCPRKLVRASVRNARETGGQLALIRMPLRMSGRAVGKLAR